MKHWRAKKARAPILKMKKFMTTYKNYLGIETMAETKTIKQDFNCAC